MSSAYLCIAAIEVVSETTAEELAAAEGDKPELTKGVRVAYTTPAPAQVRFLLVSTKALTLDLPYGGALFSGW